MNKFNFTKRNKEKNIIWKVFRPYIDFWILICCFIVAFNIHPTNNSTDSNGTTENKKMIYVFHDYEWNEYALNDSTHGAANSMDYLFDKNVPETIKWNNPNYTDSVSLWDKGQKNWSAELDLSTKDNQISLENIITDLWIDSNIEIEDKDDYLVISLSNEDSQTEKDLYSIEEDTEDSSLTIEKISNPENNKDSIESNDEDSNDENIQNNEDLLVGKVFTYVSDGRIIPILIPREDLEFIESGKLAYNDNVSNGYTVQWLNRNKTSWIIIIDDYADCMTPRWYKIVHGDSVLAYKQLDNAPDICNIERRYCWNWKLSWTYTQQWCSINKNYSYEIIWQSNTPQKEEDEEEFKWWTRQNPDWTVTVKNNGSWLWFIFERPNPRSSEFSYSDNFRYEGEWIEQTDRPHRDCTAPRWEKVKHGQGVQAFKHANWFSDAPCETQLRLCSMWELMWTYTESTCKSRDTSFIDRINGSQTRKTYSKEKLELIKKQIKNEEKNYKEARKNETKSTNSIALEKILYILDQD